MRNRAKRRSAFTLVLTMFLGTLVVVVGGSIALTASVESAAGLEHARTFEHELAVQSLLAALPQLLEKSRDRREPAEKGIPVEITTDIFNVRGHAHSLKNALDPSAYKDAAALKSALLEVARKNGLPIESVQVQAPHAEAAPQIPSYTWYSQFLAPAKYDEVFRCSFVDEESLDGTERQYWTRLITFWSGSEENYSLELETRIRNGPSRCWFVVAEIKNGIAVLHYQGPCS